MYETILVPTDGSKYTTAAFQHALEIVTRFDARVQFLSVIDTWQLGLTTSSEIVIDALRASYRAEIQ